MRGEERRHLLVPDGRQQVERRLVERLGA